MIHACSTEADFYQLLADSKERPVFLLKHSTRCSISARAHVYYQQFAEMESNAECWEVLVVEQRDISNLVARESSISHQSPQVILFKDGRAVWNASHHAITRQALLDALTTGN